MAWFETLRALLDRGVADRLGRIERLLAMERLQRHLDQPTVAGPGRLERFGFRAMSQYDADGILREIFRRIGAPHQTFVEFGAGTGIENNTAYLLCQGWRGAWIDGSAQLCEQHRKRFDWAIGSGQLRSIEAFLSRETLNDVIGASGGLTGPIDLASIDVDGNDYHLWEALTVVEPRVVVIEYNAYVRPPVRWVMKYAPNHRWDGSTYYGASLSSLEQLGIRKGYRLVGCDIVGLNAFFVRSELCGDHFANGDAEAFFHPRRWWLDNAFPTGAPAYGRPFDSAG